jgi:hypothetical protein
MQNLLYGARSEVLVVLSVKNAVFYDVSLVDRCPCSIRTLVMIYHASYYHIPEDSNFQLYEFRTLKINKLALID